ncbi:hypothetical protein ACXR2U_06465 [Jatrophihabitans sp. YIM 134969]
MTTPPDIGVRDAVITSNTYTTVRRRETVPHDVFAAYWRDVHGPLCSRIAGLGWYVQHHFDRVRDAHLWPASESVTPLPGYVLDGAVEIGFLSAADQQTFGEASSLLFGDERNVFEETVAYDLPDGSHTLVDRQADPVPNGVDPYDRLHVHLGRREDAGDAFDAMVTAVARAAVADEGVVKVRVHQPSRYDNAHPAPPAPDVVHEVEPGRTALAVLELAFTDPLARRRFFASDAFGATLDAQRAAAASITAFAVSGVFTFVRDARLTTAGRRGSRVAELVSALAAVNQVEPDVERLFVAGA